jgi:hypothetical protein
MIVVVTMPDTIRNGMSRLTTRSGYVASCHVGPSASSISSGATDEIPQGAEPDIE